MLKQIPELQRLFKKKRAGSPKRKSTKPDPAAGKKPPVLQKEQEYPNIKWNKLDDPEVQRAVILYNDRVNTWRRMVEIDLIIDNKPTAKLVQELAESRIRNLQAFRELDNYNRTGKFLNRHPLVAHFSTRQQLEQLLRENPDKFQDEYSNCRENVKRYKSYLKNKKRTEAKHAKDLINLKKHQERLDIMKDILSSIMNTVNQPQ